MSFSFLSVESSADFCFFLKKRNSDFFALTLDFSILSSDSSLSLLFGTTCNSIFLSYFFSIITKNKMFFFINYNLDHIKNY